MLSICTLACLGDLPAAAIHPGTGLGFSDVLLLAARICF
jgi:hypothetical protein